MWYLISKPKSKTKAALVPYPDEWTFSYKWHDRIEQDFTKVNDF